MTNKDTTIRDGLHALDLSNDEIEVYLELLRRPSTPLQISRDTGITRTKVYRIVETLEKRSLVARHADERGVFFVVTEPQNLGIELAQRETKLEKEHQVLRQLVPMLTALQGNEPASPFMVRTYEGYAGFRQMCWHELKAKGEILALGSGDLEELIPNRRWSERHRERSVEAGYRVREIINSEVDLPTFIANQDYMQQYTCRGISARILPLDNQMIIYNDTVAIYHWRQQKKVGIEILSRTFADTMRAIFEQYWALAEPKTTRPH